MQIDGQPKITCVATSEVTTMLVTSAGGHRGIGPISMISGKVVRQVESMV